jgi:hypothetical protein
VPPGAAGAQATTTEANARLLEVIKNWRRLNLPDERKLFCMKISFV